MVEALSVFAVFAYIAGIFMIRYFIGEKAFWNVRHLKPGYQVLLSRRFDAYLFDTLAVCFLSLLVFILCAQGKSAFLGSETATAVLCGASVLMFLCARSLGRFYALYSEQGLLLSKPFQSIRSVPWSEIGSIQKRHTSAQLYNVSDLTGHRLTWFPLNRKTQSFLELAQQHGISVDIPKETRMALYTSGKRLNGTLGEWDAALARSAYAQNDVIAFAAFRGFMVALFMDKQLNDDNIIAINSDGTVRWKISDIVKRSEPTPYASMTMGGSDTVHAMAVLGRQYSCIVYEIDVFGQKIRRQYSKDEV